jgi:hypothetical protein
MYSITLTKRFFLHLNILRRCTVFMHLSMYTCTRAATALQGKLLQLQKCSVMQRHCRTARIGLIHLFIQSRALALTLGQRHCHSVAVLGVQTTTA